MGYRVSWIKIPRTLLPNESENVIYNFEGGSEMPIFEYQCGQCENEFEKLVLNSSEKIACPKCKSKKVRRIMSVSAFSVGGKFKSTASSSCGSCSSSNCSTCGSK
jgi:putative FmdB family regulatory protein